MTEILNLYDMLHEIEDITDLNGSFFVNAETNTVIESTIHSQIPEKILWEIGVLKDTFQQFANAVNHGEVTELMLEGDKGYILLYNIPPHLILLTMAPYDINLSYVKLAMIDILKRIREKILKFGDEILKIPAAEPIVPPQKVEIESKQITPEQVTPEQITLEQVASEQVASEQVTPLLETGDNLNVLTLIHSLENKSSEDKYIIFKKIFKALKFQIKSLNGAEISKLLDVLKDTILTNIGTSLALFDISKHSRNLNKINQLLSPEDLKKYHERIDNWEKRILKM
ncbi:MAG: hypothetical protein ACFFCI_05775 [Promethearchaeota archaeon]